MCSLSDLQEKLAAIKARGIINYKSVHNAGCLSTFQDYLDGLETDLCSDNMATMFTIAKHTSNIKGRV